MTKLQLSNGNLVEMSEIQIGDHVQIGIRSELLWKTERRNLKYLSLAFQFPSKTTYIFNIVSLCDGITYNEVKAFLKKQPDAIMEYKRISVLGNKTVSLSGNHLIYSRTSYSDRFLSM